MEQAEKFKKTLLIIVLAIAVYFTAYILTNYVLQAIGIETYDWRFDSPKISPMHLAMPLIAFTLIFFGMQHWQKSFNEKRKVLALLLVLLMFFSLTLFWVNLAFFHSALIARQENAVLDVCLFGCRFEEGFRCFQETENETIVCQVNYWHEFKSSAFLIFWLSAIFSGASYFIYRELEEQILKK